MVANMLGTSGSSWSDAFSAYHSGTYNNQWLIVDLNVFEPGVEPSSDVLWVTEEAPGLMHAQDQTASLVSAGYWASYNVAYYQDVREVSRANVQMGPEFVTPKAEYKVHEWAASKPSGDHTSNQCSATATDRQFKC